MPYILEDLVVDRVDFVDEGANSASFIELYKRKEQRNMDLNVILTKMKPEHAEVIQSALNANETELAKAKEDLATATNDLATANASLAAANEELAKAKADLEALQAATSTSGTENSEEELLKSMPQAARDLFVTLRTQKDAAEEELRKAKEAEKNAEAIAKAKELKSIPIEQDKLVGIIKSATPEMLDLLTTVNSAINSTVLTEVGKNHTGSADAWSKIEAKAQDIAVAEGVSKERAVAKAIEANPELYREYLNGGAN